MIRRNKRQPWIWGLTALAAVLAMFLIVILLRSAFLAGAIDTPPGSTTTLPLVSPSPSPSSSPVPTSSPDGPLPTTVDVPGLIPYSPAPTPTPTASPRPESLMGQPLFEKRCASCHGLPLRNNLLANGDDAFLAAVGRGVGRMEPYGGGKGSLTREQQASLLTFVRQAPTKLPVGPFYPHPDPKGGCASCHSAGYLGFPVSSLHANMDDALCPACHYPALVQPGAVPHEPSSAPDCFDCHRATGSAPLPEDHRKRTDSLCSFCHAGSKIPPSAPHSRMWTDCATCHTWGSAIAPPRTHQGTGWGKCAIPACHGVMEY